MKIKKVLIIVFAVVIGMVLSNFSVLASNALNIYYNDSKSHNYISNIVSEKELLGNTTLIHDNGNVLRSNQGGFEQNVHILKQKSNVEEGTKVVSWAAYNENHSVSAAFNRHNLLDIALDYEKNHPGWKVVGGINADQYYSMFGTALHTDGSDYFYNQPYYPMMADGENWFTIDALGRTGINVTGFKNDGSVNPLIYNSVNTANFKLSIYDENNNLLGKFDINDLNPKSKVTGEYTYLYALVNTSGTSKENDITKSVTVNASTGNKLYIVNAADKCWVNNSTEYSWYKSSSAVNSFFGKGEIDQVSDTATLKATQFAIETTNKAVLDLLEEGAYVLAQHEYDDENLQKCETAIGWHSIQRMNGVDNANIGNSYNSRAYPRSVFGVTSDGSICLISVEGSNSNSLKGLWAQEVNALCKAYDIVTAFQMDGGGSVTMIARGEDGQLGFVNNSVEQTYRNILSGLFFVVKDLESEISISNLTSDKIEMDVNINDYGIFKNVTNSYVNIKGSTATGKVIEQTKEIIDGKVIFENLAPNVKYNYKIQLKIEGKEELQSTFTSGDITTSKRIFSLREFKIDFNEGELKVNIVLNDPDKSIDGMIKLSFDGGKTFEFINPGKSYSIKDFEGDPLSNIYLKFDYNLNDGEGTKTLEFDDLDVVANPIAYMEAILYNINNQCESCFKSK